ncbi:MAG: hypothetical protein J7J78_00240 [Thermoprotei archaeon]|nr:hypothetical protein [Thermoprotei archaeon]
MSSDTLERLEMPCEIVAKKLMPTIRALIAEVLVKKYGFTIYETAKILGLTPAAISNYLLGKRGADTFPELKENRLAYNLILLLADKIASQRCTSVDCREIICTICRTLIKRPREMWGFKFR